MQSMIVVSCFLLCLQLVLVVAKTPPNMQGSFSSGLIYDEVPWGRRQGRNVTAFSGGWCLDHNEDKRVIFINQSTVLLRRVEDLKAHVVYLIIDKLHHCQVQALDPSYGQLFTWVPFSHFVGDNVLFGAPVETWTLAAKDATLTLHTKRGRGTPMRQTIESDTDQLTRVYDFPGLFWGTPPRAYFEVPSYCHKVDGGSVEGLEEAMVEGLKGLQRIAEGL